MKHQWEPTDSEGFCLQCVNCGTYISAWEESGTDGQGLYDQMLDADNCTMGKACQCGG